MATGDNSDQFKAVQDDLKSRRGEFTRNPLISNGGRILNILDPDAYGWDNVKAEVERYGFASLTMVETESSLAKLAEIYGDKAEFPTWQVFVGKAAEVESSCAALLEGKVLPKGFTLFSSTSPDAELIEAVQTLNAETGVAPAPAYYLAGAHYPSMITGLYSDTGRLIGCAHGSMRYHAESRFAGWLFAGSVSVHPDFQRRGFGHLLNATLLRKSRKAFNWTHALEQARENNLASVGMIRSCGLMQQVGFSTIAINAKGGFLTR